MLSCVISRDVEMEALQQGEVKVPLGGDKVYKDQCVFSFDTPVS